jgi:hypothetical protein
MAGTENQACATEKLEDPSTTEPLLKLTVIES